MARSSRPGLSAAAWFAAQSFTSASRPAFGSFEFVAAAAGLPVAAPVVAYLLHVRDRRGVEITQRFSTALLRSCALIALAKQPVDLRIEDVTVTS
jgi:hypothetical protein